MKTLTLSPSRLMTYLQCGEKYRLRHVEQIPEQRTGSMIGGSAVHAAIAESETNGWWSNVFNANADGPIVKAFERSLYEQIAEAGGPDQILWGGRASIRLDDRGDKVQARDESGALQFRVGANGRKLPIWEKANEDLRWWLTSGPMMLRVYVNVRQSLQDRGWRSPIDSAEMYVSTTIPIGSDVELFVRGYVDKLMLVTEDGEAVVIDWKTGAFTDLVQLVSYAMLLASSHGITASRGVFVKLRPNAKERLIEHELSALVPVLPELYATVATRIERGDFAIQPSSWCSSCTVRQHCSWGSKLPDKELEDG